jgi:hypothetical protein
MKNSTVVEEYKISFLPIVRVHPAGSDTRSLEPMHDLTNLSQVFNDSAIREVKLSDGRGVDLKG